MNKIGVISMMVLMLSLSIGCTKKMIVVETAVHRTEAIIIDHTCTDITQIPEHWIKKAPNGRKMGSDLIKLLNYGTFSNGLFCFILF